MKEMTVTPQGGTAEGDSAVRLDHVDGVIHCAGDALPLRLTALTAAASAPSRAYTGPCARHASQCAWPRGHRVAPGACASLDTPTAHATFSRPFATTDGGPSSTRSL